MSYRPRRIGVTRWEDVPGERIEDYWECVAGAGGEPLDLHPSKTTPAADVSSLDALILTGGIDVDPARYGEPRHTKVRQVDPERDAFELTLLGGALAAGLPVLAICRGHQLLNVACGGTLLQHNETRTHVADYHSEGFPSRWHAVPLTSGSRLRHIYGAEEIMVNSRHHQGLTADMLAADLAPVALTPDGLVEAVESRRHDWVVGVQWHPERPEPDRPAFRPASQRLFDAFVAAEVRQPA